MSPWVAFGIGFFIGGWLMLRITWPYVRIVMAAMDDGGVEL